MNSETFYQLMKIIALLLIGAIVLICLLLLFVTVPPDNKDLFNMILMALIGNAGIVVGWLFGSSKSSSDKNQIIADAQKE